MNGKKIGSISYADDKVLIAETPQQLQRMIHRLAMENEKYGMRINVSRIKVMQITKSRSIRPLKIVVSGTLLEEVQSSRYLECLITSDGRDDKKIVTRIGMARSALNNLEHVVKDRKMNIGLGRRILLCYVWPILRYASETWTMSERIENKIHAFEM